MISALKKQDSIKSGLLGWLEGIETHERITLAFFVYAAGLAVARGIALPQRSALVVLPFALVAAWRVESMMSRDWSRILRQWLSLGLILVAYWSIGCFASDKLGGVQSVLIDWDRVVLTVMRPAVEALGGVIPFVLELVYLLLYAIPPICLAALYFYRASGRAPVFLRILFLGTLTVYGMLPYIPVSSPYFAFPLVDPPGFTSAVRELNTWLLARLDIDTSVFPSGHVAVAFSTAFGMRAAIPERRWVWLAAFAAAAIVYAATIYGRYHYAVDGLASIGIAWAASKVAAE
jgi:membrane-associated phospholipid phosphatase